MQKKLLFLFLFLVTVSLEGAPNLDHPLTISELVDIALENHPATKKAWWNANRASAAVGSAKSAYYPQLDLNVDIRNGIDFKFINGPDTSYTIVGANILLGMMLYDFGETSANVNSAKMGLLAANWQSDWTIQRVMIKVLENAYGALHAQEVYQASLSSLADAKKVLETAKALNRSGLSPIADVYTTQATYSVMRMDVAQQKAQLDIQMAKLSASLGLCATTKLQIASYNALPAPTCQMTDALISFAMAHRADLQEKQARVSQMAYNQKRAASGYLPRISLLGRGGANHAFHDNTQAGQYMVALNLDVPLFNGFDTTYSNRQAYADTQLSIEECTELQLDIALEVLTYSRTLMAAQEMLPDAEENLNSAQKAYESTLDRYKAGKEGIAEVSFGQRQLAAARVRYSDVKTRLLISIANLAYATGTLTLDTESLCN